MKLEILLSCMDQQAERLIHQSRIGGDAVVVDQCGREGYAECATERGLARVFYSAQRGLTKSRNLAIEKSVADICMLSDDDEMFLPDYEARIRKAYEDLPQADVIIFQIENWPTSLGDTQRQLRFPQTMKVSSVQISFRRESLLRIGVRFDPLLGSGSGNGAEEELKFLLDCQKRGLKIYYVPVTVARLEQSASAWFDGFDEEFFYRRGGTTRYILGRFLASLYAVYYVIRKRGLYEKYLTPGKALKAIFRGIRDDRVTRQAREDAKR